ncbi:MAG: bifunctional precorrin-2 dehydrogenase/sirohydrochlorin ferrochelatase [Cyclobacteriaceae bacterium]
MTENKLFPIFVKLDQIQTLLVGAGNVGLEKLQGLLKNDECANIKIVAPEALPEIVELIEAHETVEWHQREVVADDLDGIDMVILATNNRAINAELKSWAKARHLLTNVADTPDLCDFYLGSTVKRGNLKLGISTNGMSPTFSKQFRKVMEETLPEETDELLNNLRSIRNKLSGDFSEKVKKLNELTKTLIENDKE